MALGNEPVRYKDGDWYVICDRTGFKIRASEARREWNGLLVHYSVWEPRHPQDFVRGVRDVQAPPFVRSEADNSFLAPNQVQPDELDTDQSIRVVVSGNQRITTDGSIRRTAN